MSTLNRDNEEIHFFDEGVGTPIVFVHGSCGYGWQWHSLSSRLRLDYRTLCIDLPGCGASGRWTPERAWNIGIDSDAVGALLDFVDEPVHMVTHSLGAHSIAPLMKRRPDQIKTLALFEPIYFHLLRQSGSSSFLEPERMASRFRDLLRRGYPDAAIRSFVDGWAQSPEAWDRLSQRTQRRLRAGQWRLYHEWMCIYAVEPSIADLTALRMPVLLAKGENTLQSVHEVCDIVAFSATNCRYEIVQGAGHMLPFTNADDVLPLLESHWNAEDTHSIEACEE